MTIVSFILHYTFYFLQFTPIISSRVTQLDTTLFIILNHSISLYISLIFHHINQYFNLFCYFNQFLGLFSLFHLERNWKCLAQNFFTLVIPFFLLSYSLYLFCFFFFVILNTYFVLFIFTMQFLLNFHYFLLKMVYC